MSKLLNLTFLYSILNLLLSKGQIPVFTRLYIGNLPLAIDDNYLKDTFTRHGQVQDVRILRGNAQGRFDRYCYAFVILRSDEDTAHQVMRKVAAENPGWKMNIKDDDKNIGINPTMGNNMPIMGRYPPMFVPPPTMGEVPLMRSPYQNPSFGGSFYPPSNQQTDTGQKIIGEKHCKIFVREIWLGGIPQMCDKNYMLRLMGEFGIVENIQIFPKFAFIRFKLAEDATTAFERAQRIHVMFGSPPGFRILFSDPSRRGNIVSNHYEFDRHSNFIPVLFLGFPPVTSANLQIQHMQSVCERYGNIVSYYMRKNNNNNNRSYILFTYDNIKSAIRAKQQLSRRRDLLGDKRVDVTLLLDPSSVLKGRDLSYTETHFQGNLNNVKSNNNFDKMKKNNIVPSYPPIYYPPNTYGQPYFSGMYYPPMYEAKQGEEEWDPQRVERGERERTREKDRQGDKGKNQMYQILQSVLDDKYSTQKQYKKQIKKSQLRKDSDNDQDPNQIINKMLGNSKPNNYEQHEQDNISKRSSELHSQKQRDPTWSGFLTWKGGKRVGVDGHCPKNSQTVFSDYNINITHTISLDDITLKDKLNKLVLEPTNSISEATFKQYVNLLKDKIGVSVTTQFVIYIMGKGKVSESIEQINSGQLLIVMQKMGPVYYLIKDKLAKCEDMP